MNSFKFIKLSYFNRVDHTSFEKYSDTTIYLIVKAPCTWILKMVMPIQENDVWK